MESATFTVAQPVLSDNYNPAPWPIQLMNRNALLFFSILGICLGCQKDKKTTSDENQPDEKTAVVSLSRSTAQIGDSLSLHLEQAVSQLAVQIDGQAATNRLGKDSVWVNTSGQKTGYHQLIVSGTVQNKPFADTLSIELFSDITPTDITYSVLKTYPHQASSFTQGLEFYQGDLYEGTGLNGQSQLMKVALQTGAAQLTRPLDGQYFGEGITIVKDKIYQLTWTTGVCFRYNLDFTPDKTFTYHTQGWGLTHRDTTLIMSDGSNKLYFLTPDFQKTGELAVYDDKGTVVNLNELEYVNGYVFANIWQSNRIAQIDLASGKVVGYLQMDKIIPSSINATENVLNGIAYQPQEGAFYVTGKNWPSLFKLRVNSLPKSSPISSL